MKATAYWTWAQNGRIENGVHADTLVPIRQAVDQTLLAAATKGIAGGQFEKPDVILPSTREVALKDETGDFAWFYSAVGHFSAAGWCNPRLQLKPGGGLEFVVQKLPEHERESEAAVSAVVWQLSRFSPSSLLSHFGAAASRL